MIWEKDVASEMAVNGGKTIVRRKGEAYIGGSTVVGPRSGWFSFRSTDPGTAARRPSKMELLVRAASGDQAAKQLLRTLQGEAKASAQQSAKVKAKHKVKNANSQNKPKGMSKKRLSGLRDPERREERIRKMATREAEKPKFEVFERRNGRAIRKSRTSNGNGSKS